jgi:RNA-splicing ligase RtcB
MHLCQKYATVNRKAIASDILWQLNLKQEYSFTTMHNYIDTTLDPVILRKGAVSALTGEKIIIPLNMRDGSIIAIGKGNEDWNWSAPHGAGRKMSRSEAKSSLKLEVFKEQMKEIYTTSVTQNTLDESPDAYKDMNEIIFNIKDTVDIKSIIKPIYNFKSS